MATTTTTSNVQLSALPTASGQAGLRGVIASEFTKLRSVRSTYWTILALIVLSVGISTLIDWGISNHFHNQPADKAGADTTQASLFVFFQFGQLVIVVLGAMAITSEYSTGMIRTSLTAMPRRGTVYLGKLIVLSSVMLVVSLVTSFVAYFAGQAAFSGSGVASSLFHSTKIPADVIGGPGPRGPGSPSPSSVQFSGTDVITSGHVLAAIIGTALFVALVALIAFGLGAIIRHTAGAITSAIGLMFVVAIVIAFLPDNWKWEIMRFFPDAAGRVVSVTVGPDNPHLWSAWPQLLVTAIWAVVLVAVGGYLFRKRDA